jgi:hypothetical protein
MQDWLSDYVVSHMTEDAAGSQIDAAAVAKSGGIRLYGTIGGEAILKPDGSVWFFELSNTTPEEYGWRQANYLERLGSIVLGLKRFPELDRLLPKRPNGEPDCRGCHGTGLILKTLQCPTCVGLGWVPKEAA